MKLLLDTRPTFIVGMLTLLLFVGLSALFAIPGGLVGVALVSVALGALRRPSFFSYWGGIVSGLAICTVAGLLLGDSSSAAIIMIPFIFVLVSLYAGVAFFIGRFGATLWHRITMHSTRTR